jgi:hypothetical protein
MSSDSIEILARIKAKIAIGAIAGHRWEDLEDAMHNGNFTEVVKAYIEESRSHYLSSYSKSQDVVNQEMLIEIFDEVADGFIHRWTNQLSISTTFSDSITVEQTITKEERANRESLGEACEQYRQLKQASDPFTLPKKRKS